MAKEKSLKAALERMKGGVDHKKEHQKKLRKQAEKKQRQNVQASAVDENDAHTDGGVELSGDVNVEPLAEMSLSQARAAAAGGAEPDAEGWETDGSEEDEDDAAAKEEGGVELGTFEDESESDSDEEQSFYTAPSKSPRKKLAPTDQDDDDEDNDEDDAEEDDEDIALSDIESLASDEKGDLIPHQRLTINNTAALTRSLKAFALPSTLPFSATQSTTTAAPVEIPDIDDDLARELAFYKQSLDAVKTARIALKKEGVAFTRPTDYFAEMVKSEEQMGKVRQKVVDEVARKKASGDARRQRDLKKFGKAVQVAKLQERDKANTQTLERIAVLKRKRQGAELTTKEDDMFDVALDDAVPADKARRGKGERGSGIRDGGPNHKRQKKDEKFGFGGKKRFSKSNDAKSAGDTDGYSARKMKGGAKAAKQRPGKARRASGQR